MRKIIFIIFILISGWIPLNSVISEGIPFWYDPARDLILAGEMFNNFSFLGQPSGIPGFFYPPYWLWYLFALLHLTRDPGYIALFGIFIPNIILFPLGLWMLRDKLGYAGIFIVWAVLILFFDGYVTQIWNLNFAPLLLLWIVVAFHRNWYFVWGVLSSLLVCFHFGLGVPVVLATVFGPSKNKIHTWSGLFVVFIPTLLFEIKNGFKQVKILWSGFLHPVVSLGGLTKIEIAQKLWFFPVAVLACWKKNRLVVFLTVVLGLTAVVFLRNQNPIWSYHFVGVETICLLIGCLALGGYFEKFKWPIVIVVMIAMTVRAISSVISPTNFSGFENLSTQKELVSYVLRDMKEPCGFSAMGRVGFERNYEYEYLLNYLANIQNLDMPMINSNNFNRVYVAFPRVTKSQVESFVDQVSPVGQWGTKWEKTFPSGLVLVLRERHEKLIYNEKN